MFNLFSFKKKPVIEDVKAKVPAPSNKPVPLTADKDSVAPFAVATSVIDHADHAPEAPLPAPAVLESAPLAALLSPAASAAFSEPAPATAAAPDVELPIDSVKMTQDDVIAAYKIFLRRKPENQMVVDTRLGLSREKLLVNFITAKEFTRYPENINLILQTARQIEIKAGQTTQEAVK
jgi:hypothetical protein